MRRPRPFILLPLLISAVVPFTTAQSGVHSGAWKIIAPHIGVSFSQLGPNSCTWRFRNADDTRTLESMRFSYTYSTLAVGRTPMSASTTQNGEDVLPEPLAPAEESDDRNYRIAANCATVNMHVIDARWM